MTATFFWHDYETFGADPQRDWPCQFAGLRTDLDFNIIGDPLMLYCKPPADYIPHPEACLITGITPQIAEDRGVAEAEFIRQIERQLSEPGTCSIGYNSLRFDDEVTRHLLYRNFYDPYAREWQNGNSRWDLIDIARAAWALRPDGIEWPVNEDGSPSFRLERLTVANGIHHEAAHDALADVHATIAMARLIKQRQPKLYHYLFSHRSKVNAIELLKVGTFTPLVHVSGRFSARRHCLAVVLPLCLHPQRNTEVIVYDLSVNPDPLLELDAKAIRERLFVATEELGEGVERIPLKTVHINKCPVLAPLSVIRPQDAERLQIDLNLCLKHLEIIQKASSITSKLADVFQRDYPVLTMDPDLMIYSGGFFSSRDKNTLLKIRKQSPAALVSFNEPFDDPRLPEMLFRYRARNYPDTLSSEESHQWQRYCQQKIMHGNGSMNLAVFRQTLERLALELGEQHPILRQLASWGDSLFEVTSSQPARQEG